MGILTLALLWKLAHQRVKARWLNVASYTSDSSTLCSAPLGIAFKAAWQWGMNMRRLGTEYGRMNIEDTYPFVGGSGSNPRAQLMPCTTLAPLVDNGLWVSHESHQSILRYSVSLSPLPLPLTLLRSLSEIELREDQESAPNSLKSHRPLPHQAKPFHCAGV